MGPEYNFSVLFIKLSGLVLYLLIALLIVFSFIFEISCATFVQLKFF